MPRNAAQLRAAAVATGWFDGPQLQYIGDGFSIPWETGYTVSPGFGGTLRLWKAYLDRTFPQAARLHDWLYTPYGPTLIGANQVEADLALREEMTGEDPVSAALVYQACSQFGFVYFGVSQTGYSPPATDASGDNMPTGATERGQAMADFKVVIVFQQTSAGETSAPDIGYVTTPRTGGWSESYWDANTTLAQVLLKLKGPRGSSLPPILPSRAAVLNSNATILGARIYEATGGRGQFYPASYSGGSFPGDQPSVSLLCASTHSGTITTRRFSMRGLPDTVVIQGEFAPPTLFASNLKTYFRSLQNTSLRGRVLTPQFEIFQVKSTGLVTARVPLNYAVGAIVQVVQTLDGQGQRISGEFAVTAIGPLQNQVTLGEWTAGNTTGGKIGQTTYGWFEIGANDTVAVRAGNHKIGRPFAGYRGRNSRAR